MKRIRPNTWARRHDINVRIGSSETVTTDARRYDWRDPYHALLAMPWTAFFGIVLGYYILANLIFALLYLAEPGSIANLPAASPVAAFFFSVETFATVGYGVTAPQTIYGHLIATAEIFAGMLSTAVITGLLFVRFSRPRPSLVFSRRITICPVDGMPTLMLRVGNLRAGTILHADAKLSLLSRHETVEGLVIWRSRDLKLTRSHAQAMMLAWTLMHEIDEASPLFGLLPEQLEAMEAQFIASVSGTDATIAAPVNAMQDYPPSALVWGYRFADMMTRGADGRARIALARLHDVVPL